MDTSEFLLSANRVEMSNGRRETNDGKDREEQEEILMDIQRKWETG